MSIFHEETFRYVPHLISQIIHDGEEIRLGTTQCDSRVVLSDAIALYRRLISTLVSIYREGLSKKLT